MKDTYTLEVAGLKRDLPIMKINDEISIASFVIPSSAVTITYKFK